MSRLEGEREYLDESKQTIQLNVIELIREINAESQSIENLLIQEILLTTITTSDIAIKNE